MSLWRAATFKAQPITNLVYVRPHSLDELQRFCKDEPDWHELDANCSRFRLFNYLDHTFRRCIDNKQVLVAENQLKQPYMVFCTGLFCQTDELIYCICGPNPKPVGDRIYRLQTFVSAFHLTGNFMQDQYFLRSLSSDEKPQPAKYPRLQFNPKSNICRDRIDITHLLRYGNLEELRPRLPKQQWYDDDEKGGVTAKKLLPLLKKNVLLAIEFSFQAAIEDPDIAVPFYCRARDEGQLLLPLNLADASKSVQEPQCVVTVRQNMEGLYEVTTLLPLEMARSNARLSGPVTASWLRHVVPDTRTSDVIVSPPNLKKRINNNWRSVNNKWRTF